MYICIHETCHQRHDGQGGGGRRPGGLGGPAGGPRLPGELSIATINISSAISFIAYYYYHRMLLPGAPEEEPPERAARHGLGAEEAAQVVCVARGVKFKVCFCEIHVLFPQITVDEIIVEPPYR